MLETAPSEGAKQPEWPCWAPDINVAADFLEGRRGAIRVSPPSSPYDEAVAAVEIAPSFSEYQRGPPNIVETVEAACG